MKNYLLSYELFEIAEVKIDEQSALPAIKIMVEFWMGWERKLAANDGDYVRTWLKNLAIFILRNERGPDPEQDEGWLHSGGIEVTYYAFEFDEDAIGVEEV